MQVLQVEEEELQHQQALQEGLDLGKGQEDAEGKGIVVGLNAVGHIHEQGREAPGNLT